MDKDLLGLVVAVAVIGAITMAIVCGLGAMSCGSKADKMGMKWDFGPIQGCMVKTPHGWRPLEQYRSFDE